MHTLYGYRITINEMEWLDLFDVSFFIILMMWTVRHAPDVGSGRSAQNVFQYRSSHKYLLYVSFWS